jgi:hypothetical protein
MQRGEIPKRHAACRRVRPVYDDAGPRSQSLCTGEVMKRFGSVVVLACLLPALGSMLGQAGDEKAAMWKRFVPAPAGEELSRRCLERIGKLAKDDKAPLKELRGEAILLAGYAMSTKGEPLAGLPRPQQLVQLASLADSKETAAAAHKLAAQLAAGKIDAKAIGEVKNWPEVIGDINDVMNPLATREKGGEGIHPDLHYSAKVKNQNGIEALVNALASKKLTDANAAKMSKELELLGYRVAVIGALTVQRGPTAKKEEAKLWDEQALLMRDSAIELADAARKKDGPGILEASKRLEATCTDCHGNFK